MILCLLGAYQGFRPVPGSRFRFQLLLGLCCLLLMPAGGWAETVRDEFNDRSYANNDGSRNWAGDWQEIDETDGALSGEIRVHNDQGTKYVLRVQNSRGIQRQVDLGGVVSATLNFDYRRYRLDSFTDYVTAEISADGGGSWTELARFNGPDYDGSYHSVSYDIAAYATSNTRIRFMGSPVLGSNHEVYFDNIEIDYAPLPPPVAHYPLEGNAGDSSGNGHDGYSRGTVAYDRAKVCDGVLLDGSGYLRVTDHADFDIPDELTVMAWLRPDSLSVAGHSSLYSFLSKDTNYEFHIRNNGAIYWWWGRGSITTAAGLVKEGVWQHLAFVYSRSAGTMQIYLDGSLVASRSYSASLPLNNRDFYIGTDYGGGGDFTSRRFYGAIDEVRVYAQALPAAQIVWLMNEADPCGTPVNHFELIHDGSALTCAPEAVTVRACADADCISLYTDPVTISLSPSGWVGGDVQTLSGGSGTFLLRHTTPGLVTLSVNSDSTADETPQCVNGGDNAACDLVFYEAGFLFDVPDHRTCTTAADITIAAVRADATAEHCVADLSFADTSRSVNFWSTFQQPASGTESVAVNGSAVSGAALGTAVELAFDGQAESSLSVQYNDAGRLQLSAYFAGSGDEAGLVMTGSDTFVVAPDRLRVVATSDGTAPLDNPTSSGDPRWAAGEDFFVEVAGVCSDGTVTQNFAATTSLDAVGPFAPATGTLGTLTGGPLTAVDYSSGVAQVDDVSYSEVGTFTIGAEVLNYLGSNLPVTGSSDLVGRFTPHHFLTSLNTPQFATGCSSGGFTYLGQPFGYATAPVITVTAQNRQNGDTQNYVGDWWKLSSGTLSGKTYSAATGSVDTSQLPVGDPSVTELGGGMGLVTFSAGAGLKMARGALTAPYDADISLEVNVIDGDGIAASSNPVRFGAATAGNGIDFDAGKEMRWGRLILSNAYGSELLALAMPLRAEYYNGTAFIPNGADSCTSLPLTQLILSNGVVTVAADNPIAVGSGSGSTSATLLDPLQAGDAHLSFSAPGAEGYVDVTADLSLLDWLRYDWDGDGSHDDNPLGRATFGIYKGRPSLIYQRETYR